MHLRIDWSLIGILVTLFGGWTAILLSAIKWLLNGMMRRLEEEISRFHRVERELLELKAELPARYVAREDWIHFSGVIDHKLDALRTRMDRLLGGLER